MFYTETDSDQLILIIKLIYANQVIIKLISAAGIVNSFE